MRRLLKLLFLACLVASRPAGAQRFYPDDPLLEDDDRLDTNRQPSKIELSDLYDLFSHVFEERGASPIGSEAQNVNTLDEVPDSTWFTNRHGVERLSIEQLKRGPNRGEGPDAEKPWAIFESKSQGITPGFQIRDAKGDRYVIKLDPVEVPELSSAAEVIATKIFYAMGYHVPENYIVRVHPDNFTIEPGTQVTDRFGDKVTLTPSRFRRMIRLVPRLPDGRIRVTASKYIPGVPLGPFRYYGTRSDDPNDIFPHEDRRELRGLRLLAAWLNHDDTRAHNTQDTWVAEGEKHYVRHYLIDFGSTFGSGSVGMQFPNLGYHYFLDKELILENIKGFGFNVPKYRTVEWPPFPEYESVGRWEGKYFDPEEWRNNYPNPAFVRMTARDAFWAAKIIMRFTPEELQAIVETGEYSDPKDAAYLLDVLIQRQRKCGELGINGLNPLDAFVVDGKSLRWANLSEMYGFTTGATRYRVEWSLYDDDNDSVEPLEGPLVVEEAQVEIPAQDYYLHRPRLFLLAEVYSLHDEHPNWNRRIGVYLRSEGTRYRVVGIERES